MRCALAFKTKKDHAKFVALLRDLIDLIDEKNFDSGIIQVTKKGRGLGRGGLFPELCGRVLKRVHPAESRPRGKKRCKKARAVLRREPDHAGFLKT